MLLPGSGSGGGHSVDLCPWQLRGLHWFDSLVKNTWFWEIGTSPVKASLCPPTVVLFTSNDLPLNYHPLRRYRRF